MNSPRTRDVAIASAAIAAMVMIVLALHGTEEAGLRAVIRATARTSAICIALAFARIRTRESLIVLPVSHAMHYAAILALAFATTPTNTHIRVTSIGGVAIFVLMVLTAMRPATWRIYLLWIIFAIAFVIRDMHMPIYPAVMAMLLGAMIVRLLSTAGREKARVERAA
jgi:hypothetical protein